MPHFLHVQRSFYISTSFKVMYSTLAQHGDLLVPRRNRQILAQTWRAALGMTSRPHYLIVRDPYRRLESFFRDKFRQHPAQCATSAASWQHCQQIFFPLLGIDRGAGTPAIGERLLDVGFSEFVHHLPRVYRRDLHLRPQVDTRLVSIRGVALGWIRPTRILRIESPADLAFLAELLGRDLGAPINTTGEADAECAWNPELRAIANRVYRRDFRLYRYPRICD